MTSTFADVGFYSLFIGSVIFSVITIIRATKFSIVWSSLAMIFWFALAAITPYVFHYETTTPPMVGVTPFAYLSWLWFAVGIIFELIGITYTITSLKADSETKDFQV